MSDIPVNQSISFELIGDCRNRWFHVLGAVLVFFGSIEVFTITLSLVRVRISQLPALLIVLLAAVAAGWYWHFLRSGLHRERNEPFVATDIGWIIWGLVALTALVYILLWLLAYALPDYSWDGLWYHNPTMHFWALKGYPHWITVDYSEFWAGTVDPNWNAYPKGVELLGFILVRATGLVRLLNAIQLPILPLGVIAVICLARFFGASPGFAIGSGLLFIFIPVNIAQSSTTYVDSATASFYIALMALTAISLRQIKRNKIPWRMMPALGCALGLVIGAKGTGIVFLPLIGGILLVFLLFRTIRNRTAETKMNIPRENIAFGEKIYHSGGQFIRQGILFFLGVIVIGIAIGGFWQIRNYIHTGNPLFPVELKVCGMTIFSGVSLETQFPIPHIQKLSGTEEWPQWKRIAYNWLEGLGNWNSAVIRYASRSGGLGFLWLFGCLPSIIYLSFRSFRGRLEKGLPYRLIFFSLIVITLILFFVMPRNHNHLARYTIWLYGLGLPCFAVVAGRVWSSKRSWGKIWIVIVVVSILFEGIYSLSYKARLISIFNREGRSLPTVSRFLLALSEPYPVGYSWAKLKGTFFETVLTGTDPVALSSMHGPYEGGWRMPGNLTQGRAFGEREIYFFDGTTLARDQERMAEYILERRIRYIIWDKKLRIPRPLARLVDIWHSAGDFYIFEFYPDDAWPNQDKQENRKL